MINVLGNEFDGLRFVGLNGMIFGLSGWLMTDGFKQMTNVQWFSQMINKINGIKCYLSNDWYIVQMNGLLTTNDVS